MVIHHPEIHKDTQEGTQHTYQTCVSIPPDRHATHAVHECTPLPEKTQVLMHVHMQPHKYGCAYLAYSPHPDLHPHTCPWTPVHRHIETHGDGVLGVAGGMHREADWDNKLILGKQLVGKGQSKERHEKQPGGQAKAVPAFFLQGVGEELGSRQAGRDWGRGQESGLAQTLVTNVRPSSCSLLPHPALSSFLLPVPPPAAPASSCPPAPFPLAGA